MSADDFNIRFEGKAPAAEVEFYGPPGTLYYGVILFDDVYASLYQPD